jgi:hypothetical protein
MEKETVLARIRLTLDLNEQTKAWLRTMPNAWFAQSDGSGFLSEFGGTWERLFVEDAQAEIQHFFQELGVSPDHMPMVRTGERYVGSWIADASVVMFGSVGTAYTVLKGVSELPEIADGLSKLKQRIVKRLRPHLDSAVRDSLNGAARNVIPGEVLGLTPPPRSVATVDLVIDARPTLSLTPALMKSHQIHLSVAVSRQSLTLENLGDVPMTDVRLGLFSAATERNQWSFGDAYAADVPLLSGKQTVAKRIAEFRGQGGDCLDMSNGAAAFVDCWIQDRSGIYLFRFFLEQE